MTINKILLLVMGLIFSGCTLNRELPPKAIVEPKYIKEAIVLEKELNKREGISAPKGENWFKSIEGTIPVIITAPHATRPFREGRYRFSDGGATASLAVALGKLTGAYVIHTTYEGPSDPNYYNDNRFKEELAKLIKRVKPLYILDLHGSSPYRSFDVDLGTMDGRSLLGNKDLLFSLIDNLKKEGILSISYNRFGAAKNATITKFASSKGVPTIQMEINSTYITPSAGNIEAHRFSKLLQSLVRFVNENKKDTGYK